MLKKIVFVAYCVLGSFGLQAQETSEQNEVIAQAGEGIFALLRRNGLNPSLHFAQFIKLNKDRLGADSSLYVGKVYILPELPPEADTLTVAKPIVANIPQKTIPAEVVSKANEAYEPLLGSAYAKVPIINQNLQGSVYYLLAGHGGPDPGAIGKYGPYELSEDEYAYDVTVRLARRLLEHGATVYIIVQDPNDGIREDNILPMDRDEVHYGNREIPRSQKYRLRHRIEEVNKLYIKHKGSYQRMLSIHVDSRSKGENIDVFFYHHENSPDGKNLAEEIHQTFTNNYKRHQPNRNYFGDVSARSSLYVVKYSYPPAVFIELGNIKNTRDQRRFVLADNRQALANWITEGLMADYKKSASK